VCALLRRQEGKLRGRRFGAQRLGNTREDVLLRGETGPPFRRDDFAANGDFEDAGVAFDERRINIQTLLQRGRRTGGVGKVASGVAVGDGDHWGQQLTVSGGRCSTPPLAPLSWGGGGPPSAVVGLTFEQSETSVQLLQKHQTRQAVGQRHGREREHSVCPGKDSSVQTVVSTDYEEQVVVTHLRLA
jgi:hypothetical protein